jgi:hypothetical protein
MGVPEISSRHVLLIRPCAGAVIGADAVITACGSVFVFGAFFRLTVAVLVAALRRGDLGYTGFLTNDYAVGVAGF